MQMKVILAVATLAETALCIYPPTLQNPWGPREVPWEGYIHSDIGCRHEFFLFTDSEILDITRLALIESVNVTAAVIHQGTPTGVTGIRYARPRFYAKEAAFVECMDTKVHLAPGEVRLTGRPYYLMYCWQNSVLIIASERSQYPLEQTHNKAACVHKDSIFPRDVKPKESSCVDAKASRFGKQVTAWLTRDGKPESSYIVLTQRSRTKEKYDKLELAEMINMAISTELDYAPIYRACVYNSYGSEITLRIGMVNR